MATYYVNSGAAGANSGASWTDAYTAFASAVAAATASGDIIKVHKTHTENLGADTTYTFANHVAVVCVDKDASDALATMDGTNYRIGSTTSRTIIITGAYRVYFYGVAFDIGGVSAKVLALGQGDGGHYEYDACKLWMTGSAANVLSLGNTGSGFNTFIRFSSCDVKFGATSQYIRPDGARFDWVGGQVNSAGSAPTTLITPNYRCDQCFEGVDLSLVTGTLVGSAGSAGMFTQEFVSCKFGAGVTVMAAQTPATRGSSEVFMYNCHSGDTHYAFGHYDGLGSTIIETGIYANDGASPDGGTTRTSWKIVTTSAASFYTPYRSPWFDKYHSGTSAITPYFEILRDGSATAFNDDEVWGEFSIQATTGSVLPVFKDDHMTPLGTPAAQTNSSKTASDWTGENATAWFGKIAAPSATTPAEVGYLRARCVVGKASTTVYLDPTIRT